MVNIALKLFQYQWYRLLPHLNYPLICRMLDHLCNIKAAVMASLPTVNQSGKFIA
jgi:hypothetical protein